MPPYVSYRQWRKLLDDLAGFMPSRFDSSYFEDMGVSSSVYSMLRGTLLFFGFMTVDGTPTERLKKLINSSGELRGKLLEVIVRGAYAPLLERVDVAHASRGQIKDYFRAEGITGDIGRKCWSFFKAIAADAGIELSPRLNWSNHGKRVDGDQTEDVPQRKAVRPSRSSHREMTWEKALLEKFPSFDPMWPDEVKKKWFEDFKELSRLDMTPAGRPSKTKST